MKITGRFERALTSDNGLLEITFSTNEKNIKNELNQYKEDTLSLDIAKKREKRSLNANAYYWVLADKIAKQISLTKDKPYTSREIYREHIKDIGAYYMMPIKKSEIDKFTGVWESNGIGWIVEDYGDSKHEGYEVLKCYYGSSSYDTQQMSRLIELAVSDAKELGIETLTPNEIAELLAFWGDKKWIR